ncbi:MULTISPECIES: CsbD family protein [Saccharopolyspora]|uniref:CsbD family protein n=1 Tax=Saccharopolyspora elongata TaxID=2530387 RepID=A0A4R4YXE2_9PSEU|nr:CsbD family protein [Saccharopolyspora elongata]TDD50161.1 CsbD family protein [Saccharopolyspora elongata]
MGTGDKAKHKAEEIAGKAKEKLGQATGDKEKEAAGKGEQTTSALKQAADKVKDAVTGHKDKKPDQDG